MKKLNIAITVLSLSLLSNLKADFCSDRCIKNFQAKSEERVNCIEECATKSNLSRIEKIRLILTPKTS